MSNKTYNDLICETSELIVETTQADEAVFEVGSAEKSTFEPLLCELRVRYTILLSRLDTVYDQILHPQKRLIIKRLLESCLGRLLEIKQELVELHLSDFTFDDDEVVLQIYIVSFDLSFMNYNTLDINLFQVLQKLSLTPLEAEPYVPQYFVREREEDIKKRREFIIETLRKLGYEPPKPKPLVLTEQQAVIIIQSHERARQGRLR